MGTILADVKGFLSKELQDYVELTELDPKRLKRLEISVDAAGRCPGKDPRLLQLWKEVKESICEDEMDQCAYLHWEDVQLLIELCPKSVLPERMWPKNPEEEFQRLAESVARAYPVSELQEALHIHQLQGKNKK
jgi:hypothetical protein